MLHPLVTFTPQLAEGAWHGPEGCVIEKTKHIRATLTKNIQFKDIKSFQESVLESCF